MTLRKESTYTLANGVKIPVIGLGTWQAEDGDVAEKAVLSALQAGYRHIDTATRYENEGSIGRAIKASGIPREEIFVTTKVWNDAHTYEDAKMKLTASLKDLGLDYVDLYLIHWPNPASAREFWQTRNQDVWRFLEDAYEEGKIRAIGVSNFHERHLDSLLETARIKPMVNQIYLSPSDMQEEVVACNEKHGILTQAYSPFGTGTLLDVPELKNIGDKYGKSPAQIALRWSLQKGFNPLPKSVTASRIRDNIDLFDFELTVDDVAIIDGLKGSAKMAHNPDEILH